MAAVFPDVFGAAGYVEPRATSLMNSNPKPVQFASVSVANGDTWTSAVPIRRIAFIQAANTTRRCAAIISADRKVVTFNTSGSLGEPVFMVWF